jgi:hypothetical protein
MGWPFPTQVLFMWAFDAILHDLAHALVFLEPVR